ncbi:MAG: hypothetical protein LBR44_00355 [Clostridiales Family XIII bacterium]|nr:hypothetical protein [Clostridiales Family XIII bacterium]
MNSKERVQTTLKHQKADRMPVDYMFEDYRTMERLAAHLGMPYEDMLDYLGCDIVYCNVMDEIQKFVYDPKLMDFVLKNGFARRDEKDPHVVYDRWGLGWRTDHDGERPVENVVIPDIRKVADFTAPEPDVPGQLNELIEIVDKYNAKGMAVAVGQYYGLFEKSYLLLGYETCLLDHYDYPDELEALLDKIMEYRIGIAEMLVQYDIAFGHSGDDYGTQRGPVMSLELWRKFYKPRLAKIWEVYKKHGLGIVHHSCGDCSIFLDDMLEIGLDAIHPVQSAAMDIEALGKRYGNNLVFYGGIDCQQTLSRGTPDDVRENVKYVVENLGRYGNMVLAPINIMRDVPLENFDALVESVNKYRVIG